MFKLQTSSLGKIHCIIYHMIVQYRMVQASETSIILCNPFMVSESWHLGFESNLKVIDLETDFENFCTTEVTNALLLHEAGSRMTMSRSGDKTKRWQRYKG
jgi:hypothetical protein